MSKIFNEKNLILIAGVLLVLVSSKSVIASDDSRIRALSGRVSALSMGDLGVGGAAISPAGTPVLAAGVVPSPVEVAYPKPGRKKRKGTRVSSDQLGFRVVSTSFAAASTVAISPERRVVVALKSSPAKITAPGSVPSPARVIMASRFLVDMPAESAVTAYYDRTDKVAADADGYSAGSDSDGDRIPKVARRAFSTK